MRLGLLRRTERGAGRQSPQRSLETRPLVHYSSHRPHRAALAPDLTPASPSPRPCALLVPIAGEINSRGGCWLSDALSHHPPWQARHPRIPGTAERRRGQESWDEAETKSAWPCSALENRTRHRPLTHARGRPRLPAGAKEELTRGPLNCQDPEVQASSDLEGGTCRPSPPGGGRGEHSAWISSNVFTSKEISHHHRSLCSSEIANTGSRAEAGLAFRLPHPHKPGRLLDSFGPEGARPGLRAPNSRSCFLLFQLLASAWLGVDRPSGETPSRPPEALLL